jgi:uncharacterized protein (TIGR02246 family)
MGGYTGMNHANERAESTTPRDTHYDEITHGGAGSPGVARRTILGLIPLATLAATSTGAVIGAVKPSIGQTSQAPDKAKVTEIAAMLQKHDSAMNQQDIDTVMSLYAPEGNTVLMGTGPGENWVGKDEIRDAYSHFFQDYDKGTQTSDCFWKTGDVQGDTAWLTAMCKVGDSKKGKKREYGLNVSAVLEKQGDNWLIRSMHFSNLTGPPPPTSTKK